MTKFIGIIPARYGSSRFPGKPLADLCGKPVIEHVYRRAAACLDNVAVATDDQRIYDVVTAFGGRAVMTSPDHPSGTDRVLEAYQRLGSDADVIINIQGDEPFIAADQIEQLKASFDSADVDIATLARRFDPALGFEALFDKNIVKVVMDSNSNALYFSRSIIPYVRGAEWQHWLDTTIFHTHVGIYAYRADVLAAVTRLERSSLEIAESLEQLRWLQNGYKIRVGITDAPTIGIDTPEDLERARLEAAKYINQA
jgi:3-deoxy-manno-octulosonate cytidylyltransferase (CMP-KDO synthetase)